MKTAFRRLHPAAILIFLLFLVHAAESQSSPTLGFPLSSAQYHLQDPVVMKINATLGSGAVAIGATGSIRIDPKGESTLQLDTGNEQRSESFVFRSGNPACTISSSRFDAHSIVSDLCGVPVPWFCPEVFLSKLPTTHFRTEVTSSGSSKTFTLVRRTSPMHGTERIPSYGWSTSYMYTIDGTLSTYTYRIATRPGSRDFVEATITYSDYRRTPVGLLPFHIKQSIDGSVSMELVVESIDMEGK